MRIVIATGNEHKVQEIEQILKSKDIELVSAKSLGIDLDECEENGSTFEENSLIKARFVYDRVKECVIADDSGLCLEALDILGVHTARFHNELDYSERHKIVLKALENVENKKAAFVSSIALILPSGEEMTFIGRAEGEIRDSDGAGGFGYDPIFYSYEINKSFAKATSEEKNSVSHRNKGLMKMRKELVRRGLIND